MDRFLPDHDALAEHIDQKAAELYQALKGIDADQLNMPYHCREYFKSSHTTRLFFSVETSAHILYRSLKMNGQKPQDCIFMDYGAGVGTLFLLASMIGCKMVIYNDHLEDWKISAEEIAASVGVRIDRYIVGDIRECLEELKREKIQCNIIASRNVIEHIYKLDDFYALLYDFQPGALIFSSTTANYANPGARLKHRMWHRKWEKIYYKQRREIAGQLLSSATDDQLDKIAEATRGLGQDDLKQAIKQFDATGEVPDPAVHGSNTCEPVSGTWAEHIISFDAYRKLIREEQYELFFKPGFWDTHYSRKSKNLLSVMLNRIIRSGGSKALTVAPFIYVITRPKKK